VFGAVYAADGSARDAARSRSPASGSLLEVAREFSPRIEADRASDREVVLDLSGLARLFGDAKTIAEELRRTAADRHLQVRVAIAGTRTAARLLVRHRAGLTVIEPRTEAAALDSLPLTLLTAITDDPEDSEELSQTFRRWGLRTLGDLAALPLDDVAARLGQKGVRWQRLARGEDAAPLVPAVPEERFEQALDLEWPIDELEPLAFVLGRLLDPLEAHLERRGRGAAVLHVRLFLVKTAGGSREVHERSLQLPTPIRDARTLRTLALLDLESHPPSGPVDRVVVAVDPTPARIVQFSLITRPLPSPEQLSTLMARLQALMGETRCGSPGLIDSWKPGAFEMRSFAPQEQGSGIGDQGSRTLEQRTNRSLIPDPRSLALALRRFRHPVPARVRVEAGKPARVTIDRRGFSGGGVAGCAGPWRTSGGWWNGNGDQGSGIRDQKPRSNLDLRSPIPDPRSLTQWDHDEWDVTLSDGATYRLCRARDTDAWFVDGVVD
jgi:protein ImuB